MLNCISATPEQKPAELLNDEQAAAFLGIESRTLRLWRQTRGLPFLKLTAKVIRYRRCDLDEWLSQHRVAITGGAR